MQRVARPLALVVIAAAALVVAGCGKSNNEGKIVGKWRFTEIPGGVEGADEMKMLEAFGVYVYFEFKQGGVFEMGLGEEKPGTIANLQKMGGGGGGPTSVTAKYKLLSGDGVELYDLPKEMQEQGGGLFGGTKDRARAKIKIDGDVMSVTDDDGKTGKLTRVGAKPADPGAGTAK